MIEQGCGSTSGKNPVAPSGAAYSRNRLLFLCPLFRRTGMRDEDWPRHQKALFDTFPPPERLPKSAPALLGLHCSQILFSFFLTSLLFVFLSSKTYVFYLKKQYKKYLQQYVQQQPPNPLYVFEPSWHLLEHFEGIRILFSQPEGNCHI